ncbi:MAG: 1,4-dihydroxy-2-naphthoate polyprenyltransferase [Deltaproteobacteria bacterium]|nr:1,4-dihydroxy-2-naphthoate polyprenyltransferase [Deltaproteobacteria bacterium]
MRPGSAQAWVLALRPHTLTVSLAPVLVGTGIAVTRGGFDAGAALLALVCAVLLQIASNLANDVFDFRSGADNEDRKGPPRAAQQGLLSETALFVGLGISLVAAFLLGLLLVQVGGWPILAIGIAGMVSAVAYTAGPYPLGYHGLGDLFVYLFFGLAAVAGTTFVQTGTWDLLAVALSVPIGGIAAAVLTVNNLRDLETDGPAGKRTMVVRFGERGGRWWYAFELLAGYAVVALLIAAGALPWWAALVLLSLPHAASTLRTVVSHDDGPTLNRMLGATAKLQLMFAVLLLPALLFPGR